MSIAERTLAFGPTGSLHGVLTEPAPDRRIPGAPGVLFWNVGLNHHVGPHRVFVDLARRLAHAGFCSLRFDTSGLGDSASSLDDARPDAERNLADVRDAMQALRKHRSIGRFVLVGFCSSVDAAHAVGVADDDVVGIVYLEGYQFRTPRFYLQYPARLLNRHRWERLLRLKYPRLFGEAVQVSDRSMENERVFLRDYPTQTSLARDVRQLARRGVSLLWIYSGGDTNYSYRQQFFDFTGLSEREGKLDVEFYPNADHTFFLVEHRERVMSRVLNWLRREFGAPPVAAEPRLADGAEPGPSDA